MKKIPDLKKSCNIAFPPPIMWLITQNYWLWFWKQKRTGVPRKQNGKDIRCWTVMLQAVQLQLGTSVRRTPSISSQVAQTLAAERTAEFTSPSDMYHQIAACFQSAMVSQGRWAVHSSIFSPLAVWCQAGRGDVGGRKGQGSGIYE